MTTDSDAETAKLVHMANQIARFFRPYGSEEAASGVRDHMAAFWTQAMREKLRSAPAALLAQLDPLVAGAVGCAAAEAGAPELATPPQ